ncbi:hypothetical protein DPMN_045530 [Dreissena polymorpha]|uniref:Uncharacterized protein n=1 Tax=Dreissena polymorpha TaxID=45954 RepID=A0A9D4D529_DREPO|nr:hypothetical protein DPMN_045530 [Dreissena polymorpha]
MRKERSMRFGASNTATNSTAVADDVSAPPPEDGSEAAHIKRGAATATITIPSSTDYEARSHAALMEQKVTVYIFSNAFTFQSRYLYIFIYFPTHVPFYFRSEGNQYQSRHLQGCHRHAAELPPPP